MLLLLIKQKYYITFRTYYTYKYYYNTLANDHGLFGNKTRKIKW